MTLGIGEIVFAGGITNLTDDSDWEINHSGKEVRNYGTCKNERAAS